MIVPRWLGAPVRTYRPRVPVYDVLYLSLPPVGLAVAAILTDDETRLICGALVLPFALLGAGWLAWSASAVLVLHEHGVLVGRRLGTTRAIPYRSIHPASIATYTRITDIVAAARPVVWPRWFILIGSTDAVSFVGPAHETVAGPGYVPPPVPGDGFVLFATTDAPRQPESSGGRSSRTGYHPSSPGGRIRAARSDSRAGSSPVGGSACPGTRPRGAPDRTHERREISPATLKG